MIGRLLFIMAISTLIYATGLWLTHTRLRWRYVGLLQIALNGGYLIAIFYSAGLMQRLSP
jgi:hypothetical protein